MDTGLQAGLHDHQVMFRQGAVDHQLRLKVPQQCGNRGNGGGVDLCGKKRPLTVLPDSLAFFRAAAGQADFCKQFGQPAAFAYNSAAHAAGANNEYPVHEGCRV